MARNGGKSGQRMQWTAWLGIVPVLVFCFAIEIVPILMMIRGSVVDKTGAFTLTNYASLSIPLYVKSFLNSIKLSGLTALIGTALGTVIGYVIYRWPSPRIREVLVALSDVTTNFAGAPLAFAFIIVLGSTGILTQFFLQYLNIKLYPGFSVYSFWGLVLAYVYFQLPLMVLLIIPAFAGLRKEWSESAQNLGATTFQFWQRIGVPVLTPSLVSGLVLLFANAFGAYATAYTLTGSSLSLATIQIGFTVTGEVRHEPGIGLAMAVVSLLIMGTCIAIYQWSTRYARRWSSR
jgi:putative spermidine/putrescine transport system permease protein